MVEKINENLFKNAREIFGEIKKKIANKKYHANLLEFQNSLQKLIKEYNTTNWENRFIVGGAIEVLFCAYLKSLGFQCKWLKEARYDIEIKSVKFSLKGNFGDSNSIRLINILGNERAFWGEPTLFFISDIGIGYADPLMNLKTRHTSDALTIKIEDLKNLFKSNKDLVIPISIPKKPKNSETIKIASYDVAKSVLEEINSQYLKRYLPEI